MKRPAESYDSHIQDTKRFKSITSLKTENGLNQPSAPIYIGEGCMYLSECHNSNNAHKPYQKYEPNHQPSDQLFRPVSPTRKALPESCYKPEKVCKPLATSPNSKHVTQIDRAEDKDLLCIENQPNTAQDNIDAINRANVAAALLQLSRGALDVSVQHYGHSG
ncbi:hypothetical protein [Cardinium endosymbiont of Philonthus spinipes]|uniref:hypothetical protein n=1 Tax=Cardinium endosymbiont of Philonthus spinipes TaxID=3077941 RepID=UPI00313AE10F